MISLLIPTRGRPKGMQIVTESALATAKYPDNIEVVFYIDNDDTNSIVKVQELEDVYSNRNVKHNIGPQERVLSKLWNICYNNAIGPYYHHCGDDVAFCTQNWDDIIINAFQQFSDKIVFVFGRDGIVDSADLGTHGFLHENWIRTIGYFVPPYFSADYNDTWLTDIAKRINRLFYVPELYIEHRHFSKGKSQLDETYKMRRGLRKQDKNRSLYNHKEFEREQDAQKLLEYIQKVKNDSSV